MRNPRRFLQTLLSITTAVAVAMPSFAPAAPVCRDVFADEPRSEADRAIREIYRTRDQSPSRFLREHRSSAHLKAFYKFREFIDAETANPASTLNDPAFLATMKKILTGWGEKKPELTAAELQRIYADPAQRRALEGALYYSSAIEAPLRLMGVFMQYSATRGSGLDMLSAPTVGLKLKHGLQSFYNGPLKFMLLIPPSVDLPGGVTPTAAIFKKLWQDPTYTPNAAERQTLKDYKSEALFTERKDFLNEEKTWVKFRRGIEYGLMAFMAMNYLEALNWFAHTSDESSLVDAQNFVDSAAYRLEPGQIRVFNETVPFPHMAVEIDGLVYSYGQTHMTVRPLREYILQEKIVEAAADGKPAEPTLLQSAIALTGLDRVERVVQSATLNISVEEKNRLRRDLELHTGKRYRNYTLAMDCATMVAKALAASTSVKIPTLIDPSPSNVMFYLAALKTLGAGKKDLPLVGDILQITVKKGTKLRSHAVRNLYINMMENRVFLSLLHVSMIQRLYLETRYGKDGLQSWDPASLDYFASWRRDIEQEWQIEETEGQILFFREALRESTDPESRERLHTVIDGYFGLKKSMLRERLESPASRFEDLVRDGYRWHLLTEKERIWHDLLEGRPAPNPVPLTDRQLFEKTLKALTAVETP